jgi:acetolactate synthase-1/2/3 large subunit
MADVIVVIGARLDPGAIGWDPGDWGRNARKIIVDIDEKELGKLDDLTNIRKVHADAKAFVHQLLDALGKKKLVRRDKWIKHLQWVKKTYPTVDPSYKKETPVNSYYFSERLSALASPKDTVVVDTSSPFHVVCQAWDLKKGQHFLTTGGISTMGYWVAGIGAAKATKKGQTIVVTGDGCLQMNIQEFATVAHNKLPLKLFVINNNGYLLIRHTQKKHMESRFIGESPKTGVWCPKSTTIAKAYGLHTVDITSPVGIDKKIQEVLDYDGPVVCDVLSPEWQVVQPYPECPAPQPLNRPRMHWRPATFTSTPRATRTLTIITARRTCTSQP